MDVTKVGLAANATNDGQQIVVDGEIKLTKDRVESLMGELFTHVCFACMRTMVEEGEEGEEQEVVRFGYSTKKPPKWMRFALHQVDLWGHKDKTQPEIRKITAGDNEAAVTISIRFTYDANEDVNLIGGLGAACGKVGKVKCKPMQAVAFPKAAAA